MKRKYLWIIGVALATVCFVFAQTFETDSGLGMTVSAPAADAPSEESRTVMPDDEDFLVIEGASTESTVDDSGMISFSFEDRPIREIITDFALLSGANIITPSLGDEVLGKKTTVSLNFKLSEWKRNMQTVLSSQGLELYEEIPGSEIYLVREKVIGAAVPQETGVFSLNYATVSSIEPLVQKIVGEGGSISTFPDRNMLVVRGTAKNIQDVRDVLTKVDLPREQVFIEAKFLELRDGSQRDLGVNWGVLERYGLAAGGLSSSYIRESTSTDTDTRTQFFDMFGRQYEDGTITEGSARTGNPSSAMPITGLTATRTLDNVVGATATKARSALLSADDFQLILSALDQGDGQSVISNPKIIVANEEEAEIHIGEKEPNVRIERTAGTEENPGGTTTAGLDGEVPWFESGIKVVVKPTIHTDENITVKISPEINRFVDAKRKTISTEDLSLEYPHLSTKKIDTVFSLESGQTAAIGGLTENTEESAKSSVPLLSSIPLIGRLFSYEHTQQQQVETIIFVTVSLANPMDIEQSAGLPSQTKLAQDYQIREEFELKIEGRERRLYRMKQSDEADKEMEYLDTLEKQFEKQKQDEEREKEERLKQEAARKEAEALKKARAEERAVQEKELKQLRAEKERREMEKEKLLKAQELSELNAELEALRRKNMDAQSELAKQIEAERKRAEKMKAESQKPAPTSHSRDSIEAIFESLAD
jgi:type IV pilus assembly protein PilQ